LALAVLQVAPMLPLLGGHGPRLNAASRTTLVTDLNQPGWDQQLLAAGFNTARPTVWVAEGLVYYLQPEAAKELLKVRSPDGSMCCTVSSKAANVWTSLQL
jgi:O-methyltransferase involved in polyketide biosynthesis